MDRLRGKPEAKPDLAPSRPCGNQFFRGARLANQGLCKRDNTLTLCLAREQGLPTDLEKGTTLMN